MSETVKTTAAQPATYTTPTIGAWPLVRLRSGYLQLVVDPTTIYVYDRRGRLLRAALDGHAFQVSLDNRVLEKWNEVGGAGVAAEAGMGRVLPWRRRRLLEPASAFELREKAREAAAVCRRHAESLTVVAETGERKLAAEEWLARAAAYDEMRWQADAAAFARVYSPISILPPDQYGSLVLQATLGCSYNRCTFCSFYRDRAFRIRCPEEFQRHVSAVQELVGEGITNFSQIFLADANALVVPQRLLVPIMEIARQALPQEANPGIYSFLDVFGGLHKKAADFAELGALGLQMVYLGIESGSRDLLRFLNKPGGPVETAAVVRAIKEGGVAVGLIFLVGAGGRPFRDRHLTDTLKLLAGLPLDSRDLIYLSPFVEEDDSKYAEVAREEGVEPLNENEILTEVRRLWKGIQDIKWPAGRGDPRVTLYDIREFIY